MPSWADFGGPSAHQDIIELLAVVPSALDRQLLNALVSDHAAITAAEQRGLLTVQPEQVSSGTSRSTSNRGRIAGGSSLGSQRPRTGRSGRPWQLRFQPACASRIRGRRHRRPRTVCADAARDAATSGAHREAAAHYALALAHQDRFTSAELADLFEECAVERYTIGSAIDAATAQRRAVALRRELPDPRALGLSLRWLSRIMWFNGRPADAQAAAEEATVILGGVGDEGLFAFALSNQSQLAMLAHRTEEAATLARRAIALATTAGATSVLSHALTHLGLARWQSADPGGQEDLHEAVRVALSINDVEDACRAYVGLVWSFLDEFRLDEAEPLMIKALALAEEAEFIGFHAYLQACHGRLELARGHWDDAVAAADLGVPIAAGIALRGIDGACHGTGSAWRGGRNRAFGGSPSTR